MQGEQEHHYINEQGWNEDHIEIAHRSKLLTRLQEIVESPGFLYFITAVIIINALTLGMETSHKIMGSSLAPILVLLDHLALFIFVVEILIKLLVYGWRFFTRGWNIFDFVIVGISVIPATGNLSILRTFRSIRALRLLSVMPRLRVVVQALFSAIPGMASILAVLVLIFYVGAVLSTRMFGNTFEPWFGDIGSSLYTLFQIMTLESWSMGVVRPVMEEYPWSWIFFVPFIVITSFAVLNLFIAVLVSSIQEQNEATRSEEMHDFRDIMHAENLSLARDITELRRESVALHEEIVALRALLEEHRRSEEKL